eukprot:GHUV01028630.1.p1 GENE.GHUV01028630.1~~GHUV01028630.1.p1  ORF type:complete len:285 (-),score=-7.88 GHUV01028630.1:33-803(-)
MAFLQRSYLPQGPSAVRTRKHTVVCASSSGDRSRSSHGKSFDANNKQRRRGRPACEYQTTHGQRSSAVLEWQGLQEVVDCTRSLHLHLFMTAFVCMGARQFWRSSRQVPQLLCHAGVLAPPTAGMRSPYDSPLRDGNRDRLIGLLTERYVCSSWCGPPTPAHPDLRLFQAVNVSLSCVEHLTTHAQPVKPVWGVAPTNRHTSAVLQGHQDPHGVSHGDKRQRLLMAGQLLQGEFDSQSRLNGVQNSSKDAVVAPCI